MIWTSFHLLHYFHNIKLVIKQNSEIVIKNKEIFKCFALFIKIIIHIYIYIYIYIYIHTHTHTHTYILHHYFYRNTV